MSRGEVFKSANVAIEITIFQKHVALNYHGLTLINYVGLMQVKRQCRQERRLNTFTSFSDGKSKMSQMFSDSVNSALYESMRYVIYRHGQRSCPQSSASKEDVLLVKSRLTRKTFLEWELCLPKGHSYYIRYMS